MLFLGLLIYLATWIPCAKPIIFSLQIHPLMIWLSMLLLYCGALMVAWLLVYIVHSFNPETKRFVRNLIRIRGARWIALATLVMCIASLGALMFYGSGGRVLYGVLLPIAAVSFLNAIDVDIFPKMLEEEQIAPKLVTLPGPEVKELDRDIQKRFAWEHKGRTYEMGLVIRKAMYDDFKSKPRVPSAEWASEYVAGGICGEVREVAYRLLQIGKPYGTYEEVEFVLSFVQQAMTYVKEEEEYPRYPVESLVDGGGDCEDYSILGASILKLMGYDVALLFLPGHAALGVAGAEGVPGVFAEYKDNRYYYCEMTAAGWKIGDLPEEHKNDKIDVYPVPGVVLKIDQPVKA